MPRRNPLLNYGEERRFYMPDNQSHMRIATGSFSKIDYTLSDGSFVAKNWMFCREYFQDVSQGIRKLLFSHRKSRGYNVAAFIYRVESKLKVIPRSSFGPTQRSTVTWVKVSHWWTTTSMKRSLFTAFLRAGTNYNPVRDNFDKALLSIDYTKSTSEAVYRFLAGYTRYTGSKRGWYTQFCEGSAYIKPTSAKIKQLLVKPN